ncbi:MAG: hypothetical protein Alpg2KO_08150 [Alphaproteobacteria bacterium]
MKEPLIRAARPTDEDAIQSVTQAAFDSLIEASLITDLERDGDVALSLVAQEPDGAVLGHILLTRMQSPDGYWALGPISVEPQHQDQGIGSLLVTEALRRASDRNVPGVFCLGDPEWYTRFGFSVEHAAPFNSPYTGPHFMLARLNATGTTEGDATYPAAFASL